MSRATELKAIHTTNKHITLQIMFTQISKNLSNLVNRYANNLKDNANALMLFAKEIQQIPGADDSEAPGESIDNFQDGFKKSQADLDFEQARALQAQYRIHNNNIVIPNSSYASDNNIYGGHESDTIFLKNVRSYTAAVFAGDGDDIIRGSDFTISDILDGGKGDDTIIGGGGRDKIDGGDGNDLLTGGSGRDLFEFSEGFDTVTDFNGGEDTIDLAELTMPRRPDLSIEDLKKVYFTQIGDDTWIMPENFNGRMILEDVNVKEALYSIRVHDQIQLVVSPSVDT